MWLMKGCPKCHGDLFEDRQIGGSEIVCLQCGHTLRPAEVSALGAQARAQAAHRRVAQPMATPMPRAA